MNRPGREKVSTQQILSKCDKSKIEEEIIKMDYTKTVFNNVDRTQLTPKLGLIRCFRNRGTELWMFSCKLYLKTDTNMILLCPLLSS
jgi:hypothetical protein